jgi:hypothetical protein
MNNTDWMELLKCLSVRFSHIGIGGNIAALSIIEAWSVNQFLSRLADG